MMLGNVGACEEAVASMRCHPASLEIQLWGCRAMANLSVAEVNKSRLAECGGVPAAERAMASFGDSHELVQPAKHVIKVCK